MTWFQHATAGLTTGQYFGFGAVAAGIITLGVMWVHQKHAERRFAQRWAQTLADSTWRPTPYDWDTELGRPGLECSCHPLTSRLYPLRMWWISQ